MGDNDNWQWFYSQSDEHYQGPCNSRYEAIEEGHAEFLGEAFTIIEVIQGDCDMHLEDWWVFERLDDQNSQLVDPDGDGVSAKLTG